MRDAFRRYVLLPVSLIAVLASGCQQQVVRTAVPTPEAGQTHWSLAADALFAFGQATLSPNQRHVQLEQLATMLARRRITAVRLVGYTDRLGSPETNRMLSRRRAQTVRDYLVVRGVPPDVFIVEGRGEVDPVVQCRNRNEAKLIACLAPNRRVEVNISARD